MKAAGTSLSTPSPSPSTAATTSPSVPQSVEKLKPGVPGKAPVHDDDEAAHAAALKRYHMVDARLRRLCEVKASGKCNVPPAIHQAWIKGGKSRDDLRVLLEKFDLDKEKFVSQVTKMIERKNENSEKVKSGWFTPDQMRNELKWTANDKYSSKVHKYYVEFSDTDYKKRTYTETETTTTTEEEMEVEQKFQDGMLTKMSKITDLISMVAALEDKMSPAQEAYDTFVEVSCRDAIRQARVTRNPSTALQRLARVPLKKSESGAHRVFKQCGQSLEIKISRVDLVSKTDFPYVRFSSWLKYLVEFDQMQQLVGVSDISTMNKVLKMFWSRFRESHPEHRMYSAEPGAPQHPEFTIPVVTHGDEGRGRKKKQLMVLSTTGALGLGTSRCHSEGPDDQADVEQLLRLNHLGNTSLTHFLSCVLPIGLYNKTPEVLDQVLDLQAQEFVELFYEGLLVQGRRYFVAVLGCKGDAPYLGKCGHFERSFTRKPTRATSRKPAVGVCHLCLAGKENFAYDVPFEDFGVLKPAWLETVGLIRPWVMDPPYQQIPFESDHAPFEKFFRFDLFHNLHLGVGKNFVSSAVCIILEMFQGLTLPQAFERLTADFRAYCQRNHEAPYHKTLQGSLFGVQGSFQETPEGATATSAINECVAGLYAESIFIESDKAEHVALQGLLFLRRYAKLAKLAFERKQNRFPLTAKGHFLHHQFLELHSQSRSCRFCVNPLLYANQMSEDFVGKPSRLARRVSPKTTEMRVLQRTFLSIRNALCSSAGGCGGKL
ncbi:unnamed protein product [Durusdinium trenchii]|uniref:Uncharacterized protein n=1 Tax=Durusdinium trenchii TaxID=1381693 RepID=A0ABP0ILM6_9DINO